MSRFHLFHFVVLLVVVNPVVSFRRKENLGITPSPSEWYIYISDLNVRFIHVFVYFFWISTVLIW